MKTFDVFPGNYSGIPRTILEQREDKEWVYGEAQNYVGANIEKLTFQTDDSGKLIKQEPQPTWKPYANENEKFYFGTVRRRLNADDIGNYIAVFCKDDGPKAYRFGTAAAALRFLQGEGATSYYVTCYGAEEQRILTVLLQQHELPTGPLYENIAGPCPPRGFYTQTHRRWVNLYYRADDGETHHSIKFLLDTGSPVTLLEKKTREKLRIDIPPGSPKTITLSGIPVQVTRSEESANLNAANINLVGTNFLDEFTVIDNYRNKKLILLPTKEYELDAGRIIL